MKFPLPADTFPQLDLSSEDVVTLEGIANHFIQQCMAEFHEHAVLRKGVVDTSVWKKVRQREQITVFKERKVDKTTTDENGKQAVMPMMMAVGTIQGDLDDVMYGVLNHSTEDMRIRTTYVEDALCDGRMLGSLVKPTATEPFRSLTLKWIVKDNPAIITPPIVRLRDVVYLESTGVATTVDGECIGYQLLHSVELPGIHELHEYNIVRANVSFCYLYQQATDNVVSVYMKGIMNVFGSVPPSITAFSASESLVTTWRNVHCAQLKKLAWIVRTSKPTDLSLEKRNACSVCNSSMRSSSSLRDAKDRCCACRERACSRCSVHKKLAYYLPTKPNAPSLVKMKFCTRCMLRASQTSAVTAALQEVADAESGVRHLAHSFSLVRDTLPSSSISSTV